MAVSPTQGCPPVIQVQQSVYDKWTAEVLALKPGKRKNWKAVMVHTDGSDSRVRYRPEPIVLASGVVQTHFETKVSAKKAADYVKYEGYSAKDIPEYMPAISYDDGVRLQAVGEATVARTEAQFFEALDANLTGNHGPRNHFVRVPTAAGQPVRG